MAQMFAKIPFQIHSSIQIAAAITKKSVQSNLSDEHLSAITESSLGPKDAKLHSQSYLHDTNTSVIKFYTWLGPFGVRFLCSF